MLRSKEEVLTFVWHSMMANVDALPQTVHSDKNAFRGMSITSMADRLGRRWLRQNRAMERWGHIVAHNPLCPLARSPSYVDH